MIWGCCKVYRHGVPECFECKINVNIFLSFAQHPLGIDQVLQRRIQTLCFNATFQCCVLFDHQSYSRSFLAQWYVFGSWTKRERVMSPFKVFFFPSGLKMAQGKQMSDGLLPSNGDYPLGLQVRARDPQEHSNILFILFAACLPAAWAIISYSKEFRWLRPKKAGSNITQMLLS